MITAEMLQGFAGVVLSLIFAYVPFVAKWYYAFDDNKKKLVMLGFIALVSGALFGISCLGWTAFFNVPVFACTKEGVFDFLKIFFVIAIANQAAAKLEPKTSVRVSSPE
jgi:hypothetical protein